MPTELVAQLEQALGAGDDLLARETIDRIAAHDGSLGHELRALVKGFRFDELLGILERVT